MTITHSDLQALGQAGVAVDDLSAQVDAQLREAKIAGRVYRFHPETTCRVCRNAELRQRVEDLISVGTTYAEILRIIEPTNTARGRAHRINFHSLRKHARECFSPDRAALQVYREILERRAEQYNIDYVRGTTHAVTILAVLETVMVKGYGAIVDERIPITPELAISAGLKLAELVNKSQGATQQAEMIAQVHRLTEVVNQICSPEQRDQIAALLAATTSSAIDVEFDEADEDEDDWGEAFDPATDTDERISTDDQGF